MPDSGSRPNPPRYSRLGAEQNARDTTIYWLPNPRSFTMLCRECLLSNQQLPSFPVKESASMGVSSTLKPPSGLDFTAPGPETNHAPLPLHDLLDRLHANVGRA